MTSGDAERQMQLEHAALRYQIRVAEADPSAVGGQVFIHAQKAAMCSALGLYGKLRDRAFATDLEALLKRQGVPLPPWCEKGTEGDKDCAWCHKTTCYALGGPFVRPSDPTEGQS